MGLVQDVVARGLSLTATIVGGGLRAAGFAARALRSIGGDVVKGVRREGGPPAWTPRETAPAPPARAEAEHASEEARPEAEHVSEEARLVAEYAERGAEEGVGASVTVGEPWEGYDRMPAREIAARLRGASGTAAAAVQLYEAAHKGRKEVLAAAGRALAR